MSLNRRVKKLEEKTDPMKAGREGPPPPGHWAWEYLDEIDRRSCECLRKIQQEIERKHPGCREKVKGEEMKESRYLRPLPADVERRRREARAAEIARYPNPEAYEKAQAKLRKKLKLNVEIFR